MKKNEIIEILNEFGIATFVHSATKKIITFRREKMTENKSDYIICEDNKSEIIHYNVLLQSKINKLLRSDFKFLNLN